MKTLESITTELEAARHNVAALEKALEDAKAANDIKVGDYVVCLDALHSDHLKYNCVYKVKSERSDARDNIYLEGIGSSWLKTRFRKAAREEIEKHLLKDAEARGFKIGATVTDKKGTDCLNKIDTLALVDSLNISEFSYAVVLHWEKIKSPFIAAIHGNKLYSLPIDQMSVVKDEIVVKTVDGGEYIADFSQVKDENIVKFGCAEIDISIFANLNLHSGRGNRAIQSIQIGKGIFTPEIVKKIVEKITE